VERREPTMSQEESFEISVLEGNRWVAHSTHQHRNDALNAAKRLQRSKPKVRVTHERLEPATGRFRSQLIYDSTRPEKPTPERPPPPVTVLPKAAPPPKPRPGFLQRVVTVIAGK
jgi:hypothetical protein